MYDRGFVFGRPENGFMQQTRSLRIDLNKFELSSENRRILRKTEDIKMKIYPLPCTSYTWKIGKMGKDFYDTKFGEGTFSANKIKELLTGDRDDFNRVLNYQLTTNKKQQTVGHAICVETNNILHYSYPFYILNSKFHIPNLGLGMMTMAIQWAQEEKKKYIYLGSFQRPGDIYKLQFKGLEWFDGERWSEDLGELKNIFK